MKPLLDELAVVGPTTKPLELVDVDELEDALLLAEDEIEDALLLAEDEIELLLEVDDEIELLGLPELDPLVRPVDAVLEDVLLLAEAVEAPLEPESEPPATATPVMAWPPVEAPAPVDDELLSRCAVEPPQPSAPTLTPVTKTNARRLMPISPKGRGPSHTARPEVEGATPLEGEPSPRRIGVVSCG